MVYYVHLGITCNKEESILVCEAIYMKRMNPLNIAISSLLNTKNDPFKQKYCNNLAKIPKHGMYGNI